MVYVNQEKQLFIDNRDIVKAKRPAQILGLVGVMYDMIVREGEEYECIDGYVLDLRFIESSDSFSDAGYLIDGGYYDDEYLEDDCQDQGLDEMSYAQPIAAVAYFSRRLRQTRIKGDRRFFNAVHQLIDQSDRIVETYPQSEQADDKSSHSN